MLGVENITMEGGGTVEDLDLDFTLPGYPDIELKVCSHQHCTRSCDAPYSMLVKIFLSLSTILMNTFRCVTTCVNVCYHVCNCQLVVHWTLVKGVSAQFSAFREGFNSVFPISSLQQFYPSEVYTIVTLLLIAGS